MKASRQAFTIFEILVVTVLIGTVATLFLSRMFRREPRTEWNTILQDMNAMASHARQEAIMKQKVHRLLFVQAREQATIAIELELPDPEKLGHKLYKPVAQTYFTTTYTFNEVFSLKAVYLGKKEMLEENRSRAYCYIVPEGMVQPITVHVVKKVKGQETLGSFVMDPFLGKFSFTEGRVKPS